MNDTNHNRTIPSLTNERWWGGCIDDGNIMPFAPGFSRSLLHQGGNQVQPLLVSNRGRWIWSDDPFTFHITDQAVQVDQALSPVVVGETADKTPGNLRSACINASMRHFPPQGTIPHPLLFTAPQYNTWIELQYFQNQAGVLAYAEQILAEGYPPGVLMIDDTWQYDYGHWRFPLDRFPDAKGMIDKLHAMGFLVMLWVVPFISADGRLYLDLRDQGLLQCGADGLPAVRSWWNGYSARLDLSNPKATAWLRETLTKLQQETGVDGFKFDAGDFPETLPGDACHRPGHPGQQCADWATFAEEWPLNELRACWRMGGHPLAQRLRDKNHSWDILGIAGCIPNMLAQGLVGLPFGCPDLIGGGELYHFLKNSASLDGELFVRHAQLAALLPMQQFSAAPWRVLDAYHAGLCREAALLHAKYGEFILTLARHAAVSGEPIIRPLAWIWDDERAMTVTDQFLLGNDLLVAPVVTKGATVRTVLLPPGRWLDDTGVAFEGAQLVTVPSPIERLPRFTRIGPT